MAPARQPTAGWFQTEILKSLQEVKDGVNESLKLGREAGEAIRKLRAELGVDGLHGRIPQLEAQWARLDRQQELDNKEVLRLLEENRNKQHDDKNRLIARIEQLELSDSKRSGGNWVINRAVEILTGSVAAGIMMIVAKALGWIH